MADNWGSAVDYFWGSDGSADGLEPGVYLEDGKDIWEEEAGPKQEQAQKVDFMIGDRRVEINEKPGLPQHSDIAHLDLVLLGVNHGLRHYFKKLGTELDAYRKLFDLLDPFDIAMGPCTSGELADAIFKESRFEWPAGIGKRFAVSQRDWAFACLAYAMTRYRPCEEHPPRIMDAVVRWVTGNPRLFKLVERRVFLKMWFEVLKPGQRRVEAMRRFVQRRNLESYYEDQERRDWFGAFEDEADAFEAISWDALEKTRPSFEEMGNAK